MNSTINLNSLTGYWSSYYKGVLSGTKDEGYVTITNEKELITYITKKLGNVVYNVTLLERGKNYPDNNTNPYFEDIYSVTLTNGVEFKVIRVYGRPIWVGNVNFVEQIKIN